MAKIIVKKLSYRALNPTMLGGAKLFFHDDKVKQVFDRTPKRLIRKGGKRLFAMRKGNTYLITLSAILPKTLMAKNVRETGLSFQITKAVLVH